MLHVRGQAFLRPTAGPGGRTGDPVILRLGGRKGVLSCAAALSAFLHAPDEGLISLHHAALCHSSGLLEASE